MTASRLRPLFRTLCAAAGSRSAPGDGPLLRRFVEHVDPTAFEMLVRRHGPMVWGVCLRLIGDHHDAEDAFQASFLVLARKASTIRQPELLANWLYGVAHRTSLRARSLAARRRLREKPMDNVPEPAAPANDGWIELEAVLDQELASLPDRYRIAILLCDLDGLTGKEAARQLKLPEGTLSSRLRTARQLLASRLARRGVALSGGAVATLLARNAGAANVPSPIVTATIQATERFGAAGLAEASVVSPKVVALMEGVMKSMLLTKLKSLMLGLAVLAVFICAGSPLYRETLAGQPASGTERAPEKTAPATDQATAPRAADAAGSPKSLPAPAYATVKEPTTAQGPHSKVAYAVADLVIPIEGLDGPQRPANEKPRTKEAWLIRKVKETVAPRSWEGSGGTGTIQYFPLGHALVVQNSAKIQAEVRRLLELMHRMQDVQVCVECRLVSFDGATYQRMEKLLARVPKGGSAVMSEADGTAILRAAQDSRTTTIVSSPKITIFPGQSARLALDGVAGPGTEAATLSFGAFAAADLERIHLQIGAVVRSARFEHAKSLRDGEVLTCLERGEDGYLLLQVTPRVILNIDQGRD